MRYKAILLDFDGVISPGKYSSEIYSKEFGVDLKTMLPFFDLMKNTANIGKGDLKELLSTVIKKWNWKDSVEDLLQYWLESDTNIDVELVEYCKQIKNSGIKIYLASDQEKYKADFIWNKRGLKKWMDGIFVSCKIGCLKNDPKFFKHIVDKLNILPSEIIYFDDSESKVNSARSIGINANLYISFKDIKNSNILNLTA